MALLEMDQDVSFLLLSQCHGCLSAAILLTMMDLDSPSKTVNNKLFFKLLSLDIPEEGVRSHYGWL